MAQDLTVGPPLRNIIRFTIPLLAGLLFQQAYQLTDAVVVGRMLGMSSLAAVGASGGISFLLLGFTMGMTNGFSIPVARAFGAGDDDGVRRAVAVGAVLSAAVAVIMTAGGIPLARQLLVWLDTPAELVGYATTFLSIILGGSAIMIAFNFLSGIIRALGDSTTPLVFLALSSLLNIGLVLLFIGGFGWGIAGAALATLVAQCATVAACLTLVVKRMPLLRPHAEHWKLRRADMTESLNLGLPMGFQMSIIAIGTLVLQYAINGLGAGAVASFTAGSRVDALAMAPMQAFGMAIGTFVAQNRGAAQWSRIRQGVRQTAFLTASIAAAVGLACIVWGDHMVRAFAGRDAHAEDIIHTAHTLLIVNGCLYIALALLFLFRSALQGMGNSKIPMLSGTMELVFRSAAALLLVDSLGFLGACLAAPLAWFGALTPLSIAWRKQHRKLAALVDGAHPSLETTPAPADATTGPADVAVPALGSVPLPALEIATVTVDVPEPGLAAPAAVLPVAACASVEPGVFVLDGWFDGEPWEIVDRLDTFEDVLRLRELAMA